MLTQLGPDRARRSLTSVIARDTVFQCDIVVNYSCRRLPRLTLEEGWTLKCSKRCYDDKKYDEIRSNKSISNTI